MDIEELYAFNKSQFDWFVADLGETVATLQCRDTGQTTTIPLDDLEITTA